MLPHSKVQQSMLEDLADSLDILPADSLPADSLPLDIPPVDIPPVDIPPADSLPVDNLMESTKEEYIASQIQGKTFINNPSLLLNFQILHCVVIT